MMLIAQNKYLLWAIFLLNTIAYYLFANYTARTNYTQVFTLYSFLFLTFLFWYSSSLNFKNLIALGVLFRLFFLFSIPNLSDDFYRFLWDGRALFSGINPYLILPQSNPELIEDGVNLYRGMGEMNGSHYTCYPPLNQFAFAIPAIFTVSNLLISTIVMRLTLILSDFVVLYFGIKILRLMGLKVKNIALYFVNPFIIIELTGNLHYEGMMIAFLSASLYYVLKNKTVISGVFLGFAISIKLIPLIFVPLFFRKLGFYKTIMLGAIVVLVNLLLFVPFMSFDLYKNFMSSIELYFQNFEFNASLYYIIRAIGYRVKGYNIIHTVGKVTPILVVTYVLLVSFVKKNEKKQILIHSLLFVITFYYSLSSIVHPWYIAVPLFLSVFTNFKYPLVWSFFIILSYSAYINSDYKENLVLVAIEYCFVYGCFLYELLWTRKLNFVS